MIAVRHFRQFVFSNWRKRLGYELETKLCRFFGSVGKSVGEKQLSPTDFP